MQNCNIPVICLCWRRREVHVGDDLSTSITSGHQDGPVGGEGGRRVIEAGDLRPRQCGPPLVDGGVRLVHLSEEVGVIRLAASARRSVARQPLHGAVEQNNDTVGEQDGVRHESRASHGLLNPGADIVLGVGIVWHPNGQSNRFTASVDAEVGISLHILASHDENLHQVTVLWQQREHDAGPCVGVLCRVQRGGINR